MITLLKKAAFAAAVGFAGVAGTAHASTIVATNCVSVTAPGGCLFNGNINGNPDPGNDQGFVNAQNAYNLFNDTHPSANPDIMLNFITKSDDLNFSSFGTITGGGTSSGSWTLPGFAVNFVAIKASNQFVLYQIAPNFSGIWDTNDIPFLNKNGKGNPHGLSHLAFFGSAAPVSAVPEPAAWAMMLAGFGFAGAAIRRRKVVLVPA